MKTYSECDLVALIDKAIVDERERCAALAKKIGDYLGSPPHITSAHVAADVIRSGTLNWEGKR